MTTDDAGTTDPIVGNAPVIDFPQAGTVVDETFTDLGPGVVDAAGVHRAPSIPGAQGAGL